MELAGAATLVTGGAIRLGRAIAINLAQAGARVAIHYHRSAEQAQTTVAELQAYGVEACAIQADLRQVDQLEQLVDHVLDRFGSLNLLVNNAGIWGADPIGSVTPERWAELFDTNVRSLFFLVQRAAPALKTSRGAIVNIADVGVIDPWRNHTPYLTSKGAVATMTHVLAKDLAPYVRVNAVAPGPVLLPDDWNAEQAAKTAQTVLLRRLGTPEDVAQATRFLATADYITGVVLPVDGGSRFE